MEIKIKFSSFRSNGFVEKVISYHGFVHVTHTSDLRNHFVCMSA